MMRGHKAWLRARADAAGRAAAWAGVEMLISVVLVATAAVVVRATVADEFQSATVRQQYEQFPYPPIRHRPTGAGSDVGPFLAAMAPTVLQSPSHLAEVGHYLFRGRRDWCLPGLRILVAGGGTGEKTRQLVRQLEDAGATGYNLVHLDLSEASVAAARARLATMWPRALAAGRVRFVVGSLLNSTLELGGPFDYIDCLGVLHTLHKPEAGLRALAERLAPGGGIGAMVYAKLGRTGIGHMQRMMQLLLAGAGGDQLPGKSNFAAGIPLARRLLSRLPATNWLKMDAWRWGRLLQSLNNTGASGFVDLFLPAHDVPMTVPDVYAMVDRVPCLRLVTFAHPAVYEPETYVHDPKVRKRLATLGSRRLREEFAELIAGNIYHHFFYMTASPMPTVVDPADDRNWGLVPVPIKFDGVQLGKAVAGSRTRWIPWKSRNLQVAFLLPEQADRMLKLIDGKRTVEGIYKKLSVEDSPPFASRTEFRKAWAALFGVMNGQGKLFLSASAATFPREVGGSEEAVASAVRQALYPGLPKNAYSFFRCNGTEPSPSESSLDNIDIEL